jgi:hypothetical protein
MAFSAWVSARPLSSCRVVLFAKHR